MPYLPRIYLHSPGGDLLAGMKLGELFRGAGVSTAVGRTTPDRYGYWQVEPAQAASAAAFAFLGGTTREAGPGQIGVHQFYNELARLTPNTKLFDAYDVSRHQVLSGILIDYVHRMGVDPRFVSIGSATPPELMHYFDNDQLDDLKVRWQPEKFGSWTIEIRNSGAVAVTRSRDGSLSAEVMRRKGLPYIRIKSPIWTDRAWTEEALSVLGSLEVFGHRIPKSLIQMTGDTERWLEISLPGFDTSKMECVRAHAVWTDDSPRYIWGAFYFDLPTTGRRVIELALRNPIDT